MTLGRISALPGETIGDLRKRAQAFFDACYRTGVQHANADIENEKGSADPVGWLTSSLARADRMIAELEQDGNVAWASRGYRDTLVEYRDSMGDL